jgi:glycosyltransferase involved in cell wall biosynthesis
VFLLGFSLIGIFRKERPDIVHLNSSQMGGSGAFAARLTGVKKIIFTGHGWAFNENRPGWQKMLARFFHILTILLSHQTIAVSHITKEQIGKPWNKKMIVIRNGLHAIDFVNKKSARELLLAKIVEQNPEAQKILLENPTWIGTISELHKTKGLDFAIEAIAKIENVIFVVIGDGEERKNLERLIRRCKAEQKIFLLGRIEMASRYLKAFDIATLTSVTEALPYFLLEAGAAGLPIIASNVGGIPEIIENDVTGILIRKRSSLLSNISCKIRKKWLC